MLQRRVNWRRFAAVLRAASTSEAAVGSGQTLDRATGSTEESRSCFSAGSASATNGPKIDFGDTKAAFRLVTTSELALGALVFQSCKSKWLVDNADRLLKTAPKYFGTGLTSWVVKNTFFRHFCGGIEQVSELSPVINKLDKNGISAVLNYSVESDISDRMDPKKRKEFIEENMQKYVESVQAAAMAPRMRFAAVKLTAVADPLLLEKMSEWLCANSMNGLHSLLNRVGTDGTGSAAFAQFDEDEQYEIECLMARVKLICQTAKDASVQLLIDAEQSVVQPAIAHITLEMQKEFNQSSAVVFNTYQCYLKSSLDEIISDIKASREQGYIFGGKLVRGAYLESERQHAIGQGCLSPVHDTKPETDANYNRCVETVLDAVTSGDGELVVASHNQLSTKLAAERMESLRMPVDAPVYFAQLMGMADHLTYSLAQSGHKVMKLIPYGPMGMVMPFLVRRAQENSDGLGGGIRGSIHLRRELLRRATGLTFASSEHT